MMTSSSTEEFDAALEVTVSRGNRRSSNLLDHRHLRPCRERASPSSAFAETHPRKPRDSNNLVAHLRSRRKTLLRIHHRSVALATAQTLRAPVAWKAHKSHRRREGMGRCRPVYYSVSGYTFSCLTYLLSTLSQTRQRRCFRLGVIKDAP